MSLTRVDAHSARSRHHATMSAQKLDARVVGDGGPLVILMHGFGAPGTDLVPLARMLEPNRRYVFPEAPHELPPAYGNGRAWWMLDMEKLQRAMLMGVPRDLSGEHPEGLPEVRAMVLELLDRLDPSGVAPIVLGGFSQGAMLACDVALHAPRRFEGLALLSGSLVAEDWWKPRMHVAKDLPVFQSHGRQDGVLGIGGAENLRKAFEEAGAKHEWHEFRGGHEIPGPVLQGLNTFLGQVLPDS